MHAVVHGLRPDTLLVSIHSMSSVHTPQEKKRLFYKRDHYPKGKHDKGFRRGWPTKKRKTSRSFRHAADTLTRIAVLDTGADADIRLIKQRRMGKWKVSKLRGRVARKFNRRIRRVGAKKQRRSRRGAV